jgi:hypothetical protein
LTRAEPHLQALLKALPKQLEFDEFPRLYGLGPNLPCFTSCRRPSRCGGMRFEPFLEALGRLH